MKQTAFRKKTIDRLVSLNIKISNKLFAKKRQKLLNNLDFTIISNNCWGGSVYRRYALPYNSPTVGAYFFAEEYIKFLNDLENYLNSEIKIIDAKDSKYASILKDRNQLNVPVGVINNNIEIVFLHYKTKEEAYEKWMRRCKRVNFNNLIVKFSEMNFCEEKHLLEFNKMSFKKKILLLASPRKNFKNGIVVDRYTNHTGVANDILYYDRWVNLTKLING